MKHWTTLLALIGLQAIATPSFAGKTAPAPVTPPQAPICSYEDLNTITVASKWYGTLSAEMIDLSADAKVLYDYLAESAESGQQPTQAMVFGNLYIICDDISAINADSNSAYEEMLPLSPVKTETVLLRSDALLAFDDTITLAEAASPLCMLIEDETLPQIDPDTIQEDLSAVVESAQDITVSYQVVAVDLASASKTCATK